MTFFVCSQENKEGVALEYALQKGLETDEKKRSLRAKSCVSQY